MRLGAICSRRHRLAEIEQALRTDDPDLAVMFARWETSERAVAHEPAPLSARGRLVIAVLSAFVCLELLVVSLLGGLLVVGPILAGCALGLTARLLVRSWQARPVRHEPRLRKRSVLASVLYPGTLHLP